MLTELNIIDYEMPGGLKPFKPTKLPIKPLTILIGNNGVGKSVLQNIISLASLVDSITVDDTSILRPTHPLRYYYLDIEYTFNERNLIKLVNSNIHDETSVQFTNKVSSEFILPTIVTTLGGYNSIAYLQDWLDNPLSDYNYILLLNQPEVGLDAPSQTKLGIVLAHLVSKGVQIILETHSEYLFNSIRVEMKENKLEAKNVIAYHLTIPDEIYTNIESVTIDPNGGINYWPTGFFDETDKVYSSLFGF